MARNDDRRQRLADAGLAVLAREGARGLTHRALDREAGVPTPTHALIYAALKPYVDGTPA